MKQAVCTVLFLALGAGVAAAQDDRKQQLDELQKKFERSMKELHQKFEHERARMEKEFKAAREKLLGKPQPKKALPKKPQPPRKPRPEFRNFQGYEELMKRVMEKAEELRKRAEERQAPRKPMPRVQPKGRMDIEKTLADILKRLERLEGKQKQGDKQPFPRFRQFRKDGPREFDFDFDFKDFKDFEKFKEFEKFFEYRDDDKKGTPRFRFRFQRDEDEKKRF